MAKKTATPTFQLGQYVQIRQTPFPPARIVELRGPLGPEGAQIYRVRIGQKRHPLFIEVREDQLEPIAAEG